MEHSVPGGVPRLSVTRLACVGAPLGSQASHLLIEGIPEQAFRDGRQRVSQSVAEDVGYGTTGDGDGGAARSLWDLIQPQARRSIRERGS